MISPTPEQILRTASYYFEKGRCSGHHQFNGRYCRDAAGPDRWCIHCAGLLLLSLLDQRDAEIAHEKVERTRAVMRYTLKGYQAGENADSKHWRERAEAAEASLLRMTEERDQLKAENEEWSGSFDLYIKASHALMAAWKHEHPEANYWPGVAAVNEWALTKVARLTKAHEQLRDRMVKIRTAMYTRSQARLHVITHDAVGVWLDSLSALLAPPEEKKDER